MPYNKRKPPIRIIVNINTFNNLNELLVRYAKIATGKYKEKAEKLQNKMLNYGIPRTENDEIIIDIGYFNNEVEDLLYILLSEINNYENSTENYFNQLMKNRERKVI